MARYFVGKIPHWKTNRLLLDIALQRYFKRECRKGIIGTIIHKRISCIYPVSISSFRTRLNSPSAMILISRGEDIAKYENRIEKIINTIDEFTELE